MRTKLRGWIRLAILLSSLWLVFTCAHAGFAWYVAGQPGFDPYPYVTYENPVTKEVIDGDQAMWRKVDAEHGRNTRENYQKYFKDHALESCFQWGRFALISCGPIVLLWILVVGLPWAVLWVAQGFKEGSSVRPYTSD